MHLGKLDIIFLVIFGFFILRGLFKGLIKQAFGLISLFTSIIAAAFLVNPVSNFIFSSQLASQINNRIDLWLINKSPFFLEIVTTSNKELYIKASESLKLPNFISKIIVNNLMNPKYEGQPVHTILSPEVSKLIIIIGSFIAIFIFTIIVLKILGNIFSSSIKDSFLGLLNQLLGGAFGLVKAWIIIGFFLFIISLLVKVPIVGPSIEKMLDKDLNASEFCITKYLYENNLLKYLLNK